MDDEEEISFGSDRGSNALREAVTMVWAADRAMRPLQAEERPAAGSWTAVHANRSGRECVLANFIGTTGSACPEHAKANMICPCARRYFGITKYKGDGAKAKTDHILLSTHAFNFLRREDILGPDFPITTPLVRAVTTELAPTCPSGLVYVHPRYL